MKEKLKSEKFDLYKERSTKKVRLEMLKIYEPNKQVFVWKSTKDIDDEKE